MDSWSSSNPIDSKDKMSESDKGFSRELVIEYLRRIKDKYERLEITLIHSDADDILSWKKRIGLLRIPQGDIFFFACCATVLEAEKEKESIREEIKKSPYGKLVLAINYEGKEISQVRRREVETINSFMEKIERFFENNWQLCGPKPNSPYYNYLSQIWVIERRMERYKILRPKPSQYRALYLEDWKNWRKGLDNYLLDKKRYEELSLDAKIDGNEGKASTQMKTNKSELNGFVRQIRVLNWLRQEIFNPDILPVAATEGSPERSRGSGVWFTAAAGVCLIHSGVVSLNSFAFALKVIFIAGVLLYLFMARQEGDGLLYIIKGYNESLKNVFSSHEIKANTEAWREANGGLKGDVANFDGQKVKKYRDKTTIAYRGKALFALLIIYAYQICFFWRKERIKRARVYVGVDLNSAQLKSNNRTGCGFVDFVRKGYQIIRAHTKSLGMGTRKNKGTTPGCSALHFFNNWRGVPSASVYNTLLLPMSMYLPLYLSIISSKCSLSHLSLSTILVFVLFAILFTSISVIKYTMPINKSQDFNSFKGL